ncbi:MAG: hypothetical protein EOO28_34835 [Comamonadaceae bacterium]|nr:MAG: hypothetical protein EOO28_34835 [Comamonadaceae bacterium]
MNPFRLALLGAPGTGKTHIARDIIAALADVKPVAGQRRVVVEDDPLTGGTAASPADRIPLEAFDLILLMGTDLVTGNIAYEADTAIRSRLTANGLAFRVIYGRGDDRLQNALNAISTANGVTSIRRRTESGRTAAQTAPGPALRSASDRWAWSCDKCSDPACEHALFTKLLTDRAARVA